MGTLQTHHLYGAKGDDKIIRNTNLNKAPGPDKTPSKLVILSANVIDAYLTYIFNVTLVSPIFEKKNRINLQTYR